MKINFILDKKEITLDVNPLKRLLDVLRDLKVTGVKEGCGEGECGACAVLINGKLVNSCMVAVGNIQNKTITTIEGYKTNKKYKIIEEAFEEAGAVQCGFCTPGMVIATEALLSKNPTPTEEEIREGISGNICRCTGYNMIVDGIKLASKRGENLWK
ncbi:(2Fe-2S)-binding protein [Tepiditoga spiralis]|uniref:(2Fe-2S)-binding protein n=1 Tax=Tepiditoga spiralis TaxID=2108365 RepID=A0A7G1G1F4_9BACT|nr:(2Fe-2S)-binding protein [Tepiditoga spiralis]BBE29998.1 (2Fe-2S)-binding protein [Tepiditoga spiralis]